MAEQLLLSQPQKKRWPTDSLAMRHLVLLCALVCFTLVSANTTSFSLTVICMADTVEEGQQNTTKAATTATTSSKLTLALSGTQQNSLFSAAALGSIISGFSITSLIGRFGLRAILTGYGLLSGLACLAMPVAASHGFVPLFIARMVQGSAGPAQFVMIGAIARDWAPDSSAGAYLMLLSAHFQFGRVLGMPLAASLCASDWGWPALYFLLGSLTLVAFAAFFLLYRDHPHGHPLVSEPELRKIVRGKAGHHHHRGDEELLQSRQPAAIPYRAILGDVVVWLVLLTYWSDEVGFEMLGQFGPTYLNRVLAIDLAHTGMLSALPYLLSVFAKVLAGWLYKRLPCTSERSRINLFTALSQIGMALCFLALAVLPSVPKMPSSIVQTAYTCINLFCGLDFLGVVKCSQRISQQFSHLLMAWNSIISSLTILLLPVAVTWVAPHNLLEEWSRIFLVICCLQLFMVLLFFGLCDSEPREWTKQQQKGSQKKMAAVEAVAKKEIGL